MLNFELDLTYGEIRKILREMYHSKKGTLRKVRGDEPHIQQLEAILDKEKDTDRVTPEIMLQCAQLLSNYDREWMQEPSGLFKRSKDKPPKSIQCSVELLTVFSRKCEEHFCPNHYERLRQAIQNNDIETLQWLGKMKACFNRTFNGSVVISDIQFNTLIIQVSTLIRHHDELRNDILTHLNSDTLNALHELSPTYYRDSFTDDELQKIISYAIETNNIKILEDVSSCVIVPNKFPKNAFNLAMTQALMNNHTAALSWYQKTFGQIDMSIVVEAIKTLTAVEFTALITHLNAYEPQLYETTLADSGFVQKCYDAALTRNFDILMAVVSMKPANIFLIKKPLAAAITERKWPLNKANNTDTMKLIEWIEKSGVLSRNVTFQNAFFNVLFQSPNMDLIQWIENKKIDGLNLKTWLSDNHCFDFLEEHKNSPELFNSLKTLADFNKDYLPIIFKDAACTNNILVLEMIRKEINEKSFKDLINNNSADAFLLAFEKDASESLDWLIKQNSQLTEVKNAGSLIVQCFAKAFDGTKPNILRWFTQKTDQTLINELIMFAKNLAFVNAARGGNTEGLVWLYDRFGRQAIRYNQFEAYREAINSNLSHAKITETITWLLNAAPDLAVEMVQSNEAATKKLFLIAANAGNLPLLQKIAESWPEKLSGFIKQNTFEIFTRAASHHNPKPDIALWCLNDPDCFIFAEGSGFLQRGGLENYPLLAIEKLRNQQTQLQSSDPQAIFNLTNPEAIKHAFVLLRHFIRTPNTPIENIRFLLAIPALRAIAHQSISELCNATAASNEFLRNELLRKAISARNWPAIEALLEIDAVRTLAEANNFYLDPEIPQDTGIDLRQLAQNRESSMQRLTENESKVMAHAFKHYQSMLDTAGVETILQALRQTLTERYLENPAKITLTDGRIITLPLTYEELKALKLNPFDEKAALKAYYSDVNHNALRYLSKPNRWMHPNAAYVNVDPNTNERWSTFDRHEKLIAMMWLAAQDTEIPSVNGFDSDSKVDHFIGDLALINRAHNWDKSRTNKDGKQEEYDDMEADRPSCGMGVERRLFQAVPGNPITLILTKDMLRQEIGSFALNYFDVQLDDSNRQAVFDALYRVFIDLEDDASTVAVLEKLNIPESLQATFKKTMEERHEDRFTGNTELTRMVADKFKLDPNSKKIDEHYHAIKLSGESHLYAHLEKRLSTPNESRVSQQGLFSQPENQPNPSALDEPTTLRKNPRS